MNREKTKIVLAGVIMLSPLLIFIYNKRIFKKNKLIIYSYYTFKGNINVNLNNI